MEVPGALQTCTCAAKQVGADSQHTCTRAFKLNLDASCFRATRG
jgi:hypothetical protein